MADLSNKKVYARLIAEEYKYTTICLFGLFIVFVMVQMVAPKILDIPLLILISCSIFMSIAFFKNYLLWSNGAKGEENVINELGKLSNDFFIINDLKLPNYEGNIDHLVLSKNGIFIIETKNQSGNIKCNGDYFEQENVGVFKIFQKQLESPSKQVKYNIVKLKEFLKQNINTAGRLWFDAIVVFSNKNANLKTIKDPTVKVLKLEELVGYIKTYKNLNLEQKRISVLIGYLKRLQKEKEYNLKIFNNLIKDIKTQIKFSGYINYLKFGLVYGLFWLLFREIFYYVFNRNFYYDPIDVAYAFFIQGLVAFLLGKFFIDILNIKVQSKIANLIVISVLGFIPFLFQFWIFIGFFEYITTSIVFILARFGIIIPVILVFNYFKWKF